MVGRDRRLRDAHQGGTLTRKDDGRESMARALATPQAKALYADGALFIGRIKTFTVEEQVIV
jgi:hypothetical protein